MSQITADIILKDHFRNKEVFADLINGIIFDGKQVLKPHLLDDYDSDMSSVIDNDKLPISIKRMRDIIYSFKHDGVYMLSAVENQSTVDQFMPLRVLIYDALCYLQQLRRYEHQDKESRVNPFKLIPVYTIVIYYGDNKWSGPTTLHSMMNIPKQFMKFLNNWKIIIVNVDEIDYHKFRNKDNYYFFKYLQKLHKWNSTLEDLKELFISKNVALLLAATLKDNNILNIVNNNEGDEINMCQSFERFKENSIKEGKEIALLDSIKNLMETLGLNVKEAMDALKIPNDKRDRLIELI